MIKCLIRAWQVKSRVVRRSGQPNKRKSDAPGVARGMGSEQFDPAHYRENKMYVEQKVLHQSKRT